MSNMDHQIGINNQNDAITKHVTSGAMDIDETKVKEIKENLQKYEQLFGADEDAFVQPTTTRKELWSYYLYYNVCSEDPNRHSRD
jgi:hypothetical protein